MKEKNVANAENKIKISLLLKISGISSLLLLMAIAILAFMGVRTARLSSLETAIMMGTNKLKGDIFSFENELAHEYGRISLVSGNLVDADGNSLKNNYKIVDKVSSSLGVHATIFVR